MTKRILCYGDSNTFGYIPGGFGDRYAETIRWPGKLQELLGYSYRIIEEGCSGRTTDIDDPYEPWKNGMSSLKACLNSQRPVDLCVILLGSNDLKDIFARGASDIAASAGRIALETKTFLKEKQGYEPAILLVSPMHITEDVLKGRFADSFSERAIEVSHHLAEEYQKQAEALHCLFLDASQYCKPSEKDGLHLSEDGHQALARAVYNVIRNFFEGEKHI